MLITPINAVSSNMHCQQIRNLHQNNSQNVAFQGKLFHNKKLQDLAVTSLIGGAFGPPGIGVRIAVGLYIYDQLNPGKSAKDKDSK